MIDFLRFSSRPILRGVAVENSQPAPPRKGDAHFFRAWHPWYPEPPPKHTVSTAVGIVLEETCFDNKNYDCDNQTAVRPETVENETGFHFKSPEPCVHAYINPKGTFPVQWTDFPATYHDKAGGIVFADGHAIIRKWLDPNVYNLSSATESPASVDLNFMLQASGVFK